MNYLVIANDILNIAANKDEYKVDTYLLEPRILVKDENGNRIFKYETCRRNDVFIWFSWNGETFEYNKTESCKNCWKNNIKKIDEDEFLQALTGFTEQLSGNGIY